VLGSAAHKETEDLNSLRFNLSLDILLA
jgi:hypothetical protein